MGLFNYAEQEPSQTGIVSEKIKEREPKKKYWVAQNLLTPHSLLPKVYAEHEVALHQWHWLGVHPPSVLKFYKYLSHSQFSDILNWSLPTSWLSSVLFVYKHGCFEIF